MELGISTAFLAFYLRLDCFGSNTKAGSFAATIQRTAAEARRYFGVDNERRGAVVSLGYGGDAPWQIQSAYLYNRRLWSQQSFTKLGVDRE